MNTDINQEVIIGGDINGHVGQVANGFHEAHGNYGYGTRNAEGERILEFAEAMAYVVTSTLFKKRQSHLVTYESGGNKTAVDTILIKREHKKRIVNTKVIPGEECVHRHHLVIMDMHLKVRKYRKNHQGLHLVQPRIKIWKLKKQEVRKAYLEVTRKHVPHPLIAFLSFKLTPVIHLNILISLLYIFLISSTLLVMSHCHTTLQVLCML